MRADADLVGVVFGRWESKVKCVAAWKSSDCGDSWVASAAAGLLRQGYMLKSAAHPFSGADDFRCRGVGCCCDCCWNSLQAPRLIMEGDVEQGLISPSSEASSAAALEKDDESYWKVLVAHVSRLRMIHRVCCSRRPFQT